MSELGDIFEALSGQRFEGDCPDCDSWQQLTRHESGVYVLEVSHDDDCEFLARYEGRADTRGAK